jgi:hypothetical protein
MLAGGESIVITVRQSDCSARSTRIRPLRFKYNESYILFKKCSANSISYKNSGGFQKQVPGIFPLFLFSRGRKAAEQRARLLQNNFFVSTPPALGLERPTPDLSLFRFSDGPCAFNPFRASFYLRQPAICASILQTKLGRWFVCYQDFAAGNLERTAAGAVADCVYEIEALRSLVLHTFINI